MSSDFTVADDVTVQSASGNAKAGGGISKEAIISLSVTFSVLLVLLVGVAVVLVRLNKQKKVLLPQSRRDRRGKTSGGMDRSSSAERGSRADRESSAERGSRADRESSAERRSQAPMRSSNAAERRRQTPRRKRSNNSEGDPDEPRMTVNVSNELSSAGGTIICASPAPPASMSPPPAPARVLQVYRRKMLRSSSSGGGGGGGGGSVKSQAGTWLQRQLPAASPLDAASLRRRCRSADAPAEQPQ